MGIAPSVEVSIVYWARTVPRCTILCDQLRTTFPSRYRKKLQVIRSLAVFFRFLVYFTIEYPLYYIKSDAIQIPPYPLIRVEDIKSNKTFNLLQAACLPSATNLLSMRHLYLLYMHQLIAEQASHIYFISNYLIIFIKASEEHNTHLLYSST